MTETEIEALTTWPPAFTVVKSTRVRSVRLKASVRHGLELVVPVRFNHNKIPSILEEHKPWITKNLASIQKQLRALPKQVLPHEIYLPAIDQEWRFHYVASDIKTIRIIRRPKQEIALFGAIENQDLCKQALAVWAKKLGKKYLPERLKEISKRIDLPYASVAIRGQRSRWGSCSADKDINLNYKLLFLPSELVDHILIHELCHTVHLNHSSKFWRLVAKFDPQWKENSRQVRLAEQFVPLWAE